MNNCCARWRKCRAACLDIRLLYGADGFEKAVMWALLELKQRREKDLVRKAHRITYGD